MVTYIDNDHPNTTDLTSSLQCATKFCQLLSFSIKTGRQREKKKKLLLGYLVAIKVNKASSSGREVSPGSKATRALRNRSFNSCKNKLHRFWTHSVDNFGQGRTPSRFCPPDVFGLRGKGEREGKGGKGEKECQRKYILWNLPSAESSRDAERFRLHHSPRGHVTRNTLPWLLACTSPRHYRASRAHHEVMRHICTRTGKQMAMRVQTEACARVNIPRTARDVNHISCVHSFRQGSQGGPTYTEWCGRSLCIFKG